MTAPHPLTTSTRSAIPGFEVMHIVSRVAQLRAQGRDVISLCAGEPAQGAPSGVRRRAAQVVADGTDLGYSETLGIRELREAIAGHYRRCYDLEVSPDQVAVTTGSSGAFLLTFLAAFDAGDRVALARPGYPAYKNILFSLGCEVVELDCGPATRFQPTVDLLAAEHAKAPLAGIMLASPANPTGTMLGDEQLGQLLAWARANGVRVISDEIYHGITYNDSFGACAWSHDPSAVVISSFSKLWGMTGWRLGWALLPHDMVQPVGALAGNFSLCPPVPSQYAALEAFTEESYAEARAAVAQFAEARAVLLAAIDELKWTDVAPADGAFYLYARIDEVLGAYPDSSTWCQALLEQEGVALVPGTDFDDVAGPGSVRVSLAAGPAAVSAAIERIKRFQATA